MSFASDIEKGHSQDTEGTATVVPLKSVFASYCAVNPWIVVFTASSNSPTESYVVPSSVVSPILIQLIPSSLLVMYSLIGLGEPPLAG